MRLLIFLVVFILTYSFLELFPFGKLSKEMMGYYKRIFKVLGNTNTTDDRKQKVLLVYSIMLFKRTMYLILLIAAVIGFLFLTAYCFSYLFYRDNSLIQNLISWESAVISVIAFILYYFSKKMYDQFRL
ncbi:hypothetical protein GALL_109310 [mine drainage metagenome]|uniref:Uncharacterized protein n=1 Tax=mine drainage metagenome TaxID=410659 RepID=A0A1J5SSM9_9ZZZZ